MRRLLAPLVVVLLAFGVPACGRDDDRSGDDDASTTTSTTEAATTSTTAATTTSTAEAPMASPAETARQWVAAIASGEDAAAIALTSPRSLDAIGGEDGWRAMEIELAEGWGAWGSTPDAQTIGAELAEGVWAVTLHGELSQEGPPEESWSTLIVVDTEDGLRVEPFLDLGDIELDPASGSSVEATHTFSAFAPADREVALVVDGAVIESSSERANTDQQHVFGDATLDPGLHGFAVVVWADTGVMARSAVYTVTV